MESYTIERARELGARDGGQDIAWIHEGHGQDPWTGATCHYTADELVAAIEAQASWDEAAINAQSWEAAAREEGLDEADEAAREAYYRAYAAAAEQAARAIAAEYRAAEARPSL